MSALLTAVETAMLKSERKAHVIPPMTDPMGKHWDQPKRELIEVDDTHAMMSTVAFDDLADYTQSQPTGVYPGKMWRIQGSRKNIECHACKATANSGLLWTGWVPNRRWVEVLCKGCQCHWYEHPVWYLRWFGDDFERDGQHFVSNHSREIIVL